MKNKLPSNVVMFLGFITIVGLSVFLPLSSSQTFSNVTIKTKQ